jgi:hypothetical protein|nr:MAG: hypothetical protein DIU57_06545 [Pseudomonadota bacterium]
MTIASGAIIQSLLESFAAAEVHEFPFRHWLLTRCIPEPAVDEILELPFPPPALNGVSGKRELHNATRKYFDRENQAKFPIVASVAQALQDPRVTGAVERHFGIRLGGAYLRIEYAQDTDGFWLEPHTDLGVKLFTFLIYLSRDPSHADLGTDLYDSEKRHVGRSPFASNSAMIFVPSDNTYHGFEPRKINGVRKSLIVNYVTDEWRAREQLSFPDQPIVSMAEAA